MFLIDRLEHEPIITVTWDSDFVFDEHIDDLQARLRSELGQETSDVFVIVDMRATATPLASVIKDGKAIFDGDGVWQVILVSNEKPDFLPYEGVPTDSAAYVLYTTPVEALDYARSYGVR